MADKPSRALVLYGEGSARFITPVETHLHALAHRGICGLLSLTQLPPSENEDSCVIWELAELLDARDALENSIHNPLDQPHVNRTFPSVEERFMGMKAAVVTDNSSVKSLAAMLGFKVFDWNEISDSNNSSLLASGLLKLLGFEQGKLLDTNAFDFVLAHKGPANGLDSTKHMDHLVGELSSTIDSESEVGHRLHLSVVLSYGPTLENDHLNFSLLDAQVKSKDELSSLIPCQSYMMSAGKLRDNVRQYCPMLVAQYQKAVTRLDTVESFSFEILSRKVEISSFWPIDSYMKLHLSSGKPPSTVPENPLEQ